VKDRGFTLLEMLVVLVLLGFLVLMLASRLTGVLGMSAARVDDSSCAGLGSLTRAYVQQKGCLPDMLVSTVNANAGGGGSRIPMISDRDGANGAETLSYHLMESSKLYLHVLNQAEADELRRMGMARLLMLNDQNPLTGSRLEEVFLTAAIGGNVGVLMVGAGHNGSAWNNGISNNFATYGASDNTGIGDEVIAGGVPPGMRGGHAHPSLMYRIVLSVGPDSALVTDGTLQAAPLGPFGLRDDVSYTHNWYFIVLPRLDATISRLNGLPSEVTWQSSATGEVRQRVYFDGGDPTNPRGQRLSDLDVLSPEGRRGAGDQGEIWDVVSIDNTF